MIETQMMILPQEVYLSLVYWLQVSHLDKWRPFGIADWVLLTMDAEDGEQLQVNTFFRAVGPSKRVVCQSMS